MDAELVDYYAKLTRASAVSLSVALRALTMKRFNLITSLVMISLSALLLLAFAAVGGLQ